MREYCLIRAIEWKLGRGLMMSALDTIRNLLILGGLLSASACAQVAGVTGDYHEGTTDHKCVAMVGDPAKTHIDDFESDTGFIDSAPLYGPWFIYADASATCNVPGAPTITLGPGHASGFAGEVTGSNCTIFGGGLGASFNTPRPQTAEICTYDVSAYDGITFYARSDYSTPAFAVVTMSNIQQVKYGGTCPDGPLCSDFYRK